MDRLNISDEGFTLLELIIAVVFGGIVLLSASTLLVNFAKFSSDLVKAESSLMGVSLGTLEEIVLKINMANKVVVGAETAMDVPATARPLINPTSCLADATCIQIRVDTAVPPGCVAAACSFTPSNHSDDTVYNYWRSGTDLYKSVGAAAGVVIAKGVATLSFTRPDADMSKIDVVLEAQATSGKTGGPTKEHMETTAVMRSRSAN